MKESPTIASIGEKSNPAIAGNTLRRGRKTGSVKTRASSVAGEYTFGATQLMITVNRMDPMNIQHTYLIAVTTPPSRSLWNAPASTSSGELSHLTQKKAIRTTSAELKSMRRCFGKTRRNG